MNGCRLPLPNPALFELKTYVLLVRPDVGSISFSVSWRSDAMFDVKVRVNGESKMTRTACCVSERVVHMLTYLVRLSQNLDSGVAFEQRCVVDMRRRRSGPSIGRIQPTMNYELSLTLTH